MTADVATSLKDWSTTAASNQPDNTDSVGPNILAENLRQMQATVRTLASADTIASATTTDLGTKDATWLTVSGTTTITGLGTVAAGIYKQVTFSGALTLTHNGTSLILPGAANITTAAGDTALFESLGSGNWRCHGYTVAANSPGGSVTTANLNQVNGFRLTLTSGLPVTTADVTGATTIYATPYKGNQIALYSGSAWVIRTSAEFSLALGTLTSGAPYDVFCYDNSGTPTLEALAWTNDTTRATALAYQDGVLVKSGATTRRYLGTFYTTATTTTEDSAANRYLWNYYHRVYRPMANATETTNNWTYTTATWRQANANTANKLNYVCGVAEDSVRASCNAQSGNTTVGVNRSCGIGIDVTNAFSGVTATVSSPAAVNSPITATALYEGIPGVGKHYLAWLEFSEASGTTTWYGDGNTPTYIQTGIRGGCFA